MILLSKRIIISTLHEVIKGNCGYNQAEKKNLNLAPKLNRENTQLKWSYPLDKFIQKLEDYHHIQEHGQILLVERVK